MARKHFFESLERENNYQLEYEKLEFLCARETANYPFYISVNSCIEKDFLKWKKRLNFCSYDELRQHLGFNLKMPPKDVDLGKYLLFCEMIINLIIDFHIMNRPELYEIVTAIFATINATIEKAGFERKSIDNEEIIVEKNPIAIEVADIAPDISNPVIEYNHYLLKGNLERKKELLRKIADFLEPKKVELKKCCGHITEDYFYLVNNMNIRHNNCDSTDIKKYNSKFAILNRSEKEAWYDLIYEQGLALIVLLEQQERNKIIAEFKAN